MTAEQKEYLKRYMMLGRGCLLKRLTSKLKHDTIFLTLLRGENMFTKQDKVQIENLIRFFNKAKIELQGQEILAAADSFKLLIKLESFIKSSIQKTEEDKNKKIELDIKE